MKDVSHSLKLRLAAATKAKVAADEMVKNFSSV